MQLKPFQGIRLLPYRDDSKKLFPINHDNALINYTLFVIPFTSKTLFMKNLSLWAKGHIRAARILIVISFILLTALGISTGRLLSETGISISSATLIIFVLIYFTGLIAYPARSLKNKKLNSIAFYFRQKSCDMVLAAATFCMIAGISNRPENMFSFSMPLNAAISSSFSFPKDSTVKSFKSIADFKASLKDENGNSLKWKEKKQLLKEQIRGIKKDKSLKNGSKAGLIILSVIVALGILSLIAALACNLSCSGSEGAAILVMIGGAGLVVFLFILTLKAINGKKKSGKKPVKNPEEPSKLP